MENQGYRIVRMERIRRLLRGDALLLVAAYATWGSVLVLYGDVLFRGVMGWVIASVLFLFFIFLVLLPSERLKEWQRWLLMGVQSALVFVLLMIDFRTWSAAALLYFILCVYAMLSWPRPSWSGLMWVGVFVVLSAIGFVRRMGWEAGVMTLLPYSAGYFFFAVFAEALARSREAQARAERLLAELQEAHRQLQAYAARVEELSVAEERNRLAREMHDTLGHRLTVAAVQLEGAERLIERDPERAARMVHTVREEVREALTDLRNTVAALRSPLEFDMELPHALERLAEGFERATGIRVHIVVPTMWEPLPPAYRATLYRVAQEGLTNVQRHAGARQVWVVLERSDDGEVSLIISDDGRGFPEGAEERGFGLRGVRERVAQLGGSCYFGARPGGGAQVYVRLPVTKEEGCA